MTPMTRLKPRRVWVLMTNEGDLLDVKMTELEIIESRESLTWSSEDHPLGRGLTVRCVLLKE